MLCGGEIGNHDLVSNEITRYQDRNISKTEYLIIQSHNSVIELIITDALAATNVIVFRV